MKFAILVPYYNKGVEVLSRCLDSIDSQDKELLKETTVFILDDHSDEVLDIEELSKSYSSFKIVYCRNLRNMGLFANRLEGFKMSVNEANYFINLDVDDELADDALTIINDTLKEKPVDILQYEISTNPPDGIGPSAYLDTYDSIPKILKDRKFLFGSMCDKCFSKKAIETIIKEYGVIGENLYINMMEDMMFTLSYFGKDDLSYRHIDNFLYVYNVEEETSISNTDNKVKTTEFILNAIKNVVPKLHIIPECSVELKSYIYRIMFYANPLLDWNTFNAWYPVEGDKISFD